MKKSLLSIGLAAAVLFASGAVEAQKLYRWVDKDGKVQYSDTVPPSEVDQARQEINAQGRTVDRVDRALTADELAARDAAAEQAEIERKKQAEIERMDDVLMASYETEADLERSYAERFDLVEQSIASAKVGIRSQENSLAEILAHAADLERAGRPVSDNIKQAIETSRRQVREQNEYLVKREGEQAALQTEYDGLLARYRLLKAEMEAAQEAREETSGAVKPSSG